MKNKSDYSVKFDSFRDKTLFIKLDDVQQQFIRDISFKLRLTYQEFRQVVEACRDLRMWGEEDLQTWWIRQDFKPEKNTPHQKKKMIQQLHSHMNQLRSRQKEYADPAYFKLKNREPNVISSENENKKIVGMCPVASDRTVCCNLHTIDAVKNCLYGCSYCTIQTFYGRDILVQKDIKKKLDKIKIEPDRFYHFGTGQSSDSLAWGNRNGILDAHINFAAENPNILVEFKTKSPNIKYFLENNIPQNIVCSWSLNTPIIIDTEEHFTAPLDQRIEAARAVTNVGVKTAFHFHPLVWYAGWEEDYFDIVRHIMAQFKPEEVLFISFGSVTLIKPVVQKIRDLGNPTKTLQMEFISDPHGKLTYPDDIKIKMFRHMHHAFELWRDKVFFYLCMEKADIWKESFGYVYENNEEFERDFGQKTMPKLTHSPAIRV
jgi:spore photoproduct lyase